MQRPGPAPDQAQPGIFKWAHYLGSSYSNIRLPRRNLVSAPLPPPAPLPWPADHRRFIMKAYARCHQRRRFSRYPWLLLLLLLLLLCLSERVYGEGDPSPMMMRHRRSLSFFLNVPLGISMRCLRSRSRRSVQRVRSVVGITALPRKTVAPRRIRYDHLSLSLSSADQRILQRTSRGAPRARRQQRAAVTG